MPKSRTDYWRPKLDGNKRRDVRNRRALRRMGWKVLVVWECETQKGRIDKLTKKILHFLEY